MAAEVDEGSAFQVLRTVRWFGVCEPDAGAMAARVIGRFGETPADQLSMPEDGSGDEVGCASALHEIVVDAPQRKKGRALRLCRASAERRGKATGAEWLARRERSNRSSDRVVIVGGADGGRRGFTAKSPRRPDRARTTRGVGFRLRGPEIARRRVCGAGGSAVSGVA